MSKLAFTAVWAWLLAMGPSGLASGDGSSERGSFAREIQPLLANYCYDCHGAETQKAELDLEQFGDSPVIYQDRKTWEKVVEMLEGREMPPEKKAQPREEERVAMVQFLRGGLDEFDCDEFVEPGRVTIRRLNKAEYNNTVRDLVGLDLQPAAEFPNDDVGFGFDNIGDLLSLPPLLMEKYMAAAELIATAAIDADYPPSPPTISLKGSELKPNADDGEEGSVREEGSLLGLYREGEGWKPVKLERDGEYVIRVRSHGDQAGLEPPALEVRWDEKAIANYEVKATSSDPEIFETKLRAEAGEHRLAVAYLNNYVVNDHPNPELNGDRNLFVHRVEVVGPTDAEPPPPRESHARIVGCEPEPGEEMKCAREVMERFASRAYRRPVAGHEVDRLVKFVEMVLEDGGSFSEGVQLAVQAVLVSPHFLYRWELDPQDADGNVRELNDWELASRLSYFLWSSMPDEELAELAREGKLQDEEVLVRQVERMLLDPKADGLVENFAGQWLQFRNLKSLSPDPELFPEFDEELREAMQRETELFFAAIMREDRSVLEFLDADFTHLNERLARHYGIEGVEGKEFQRVSLARDNPRGGVLAQASVLSITSNPTRTSPVNRGKWILEQILGTPPPPPPPDVPELEEEGEEIEGGSLRKRLELHRAKAECATCHAKMDPIGFAFENFDAIGAWREMDGEFPVDPSGTLPTGEEFSGPEGLKEILKSRESFVRSLSEKMLTYALGRGLQYYDKCAVDEICGALKEHEYRFSVLVTEIVKSEPFLMKSLEGDRR